MTTEWVIFPSCEIIPKCVLPLTCRLLDLLKHVLPYHTAEICLEVCLWRLWLYQAWLLLNDVCYRAKSTTKSYWRLEQVSPKQTNILLQVLSLTMSSLIMWRVVFLNIFGWVCMHNLGIITLATDIYSLHADIILVHKLHLIYWIKDLTATILRSPLGS